MAKILVAYYSKGGNVKKMAEFVAKGVKEESCEVTVKTVDSVLPDELIHYDGFIFGSPTYYGQMAAPVKKLIDDSVILHGKLEGKVGGAFTSSANIGGGNETTILSILQAFLIHGMLIQGTAKNDHYGPVAIGSPDNRAEKQCIALGKRVAKLVKIILI
ncbi:MAG: flavodoxin [Elusimicrobia bacterium CG06_land_8_20_14_3_00_38_11]|nr:MAG: flavodoxin [Elusimicrobia bacterium CG06_land_8_20_14_3_00_38_11]